MVKVVQGSGKTFRAGMGALKETGRACTASGACKISEARPQKENKTTFSKKDIR